MSETRELTIVGSGVAETATERQTVVTSTVDLAAERALPIVVCAEDHSSWGSKKVIFGLGRAWGQWLHALELASIDDIHQVRPQTWRKVALGLPGTAKADLCKAVAVEAATALLGRPAGPDESEAVCLAIYAAQTLKPKRRVRKVI